MIILCLEISWLERDIRDMMRFCKEKGKLTDFSWCEKPIISIILEIWFRFSVDFYNIELWSLDRKSVSYPNHKYKSTDTLTNVEHIYCLVKSRQLIILFTRLRKYLSSEWVSKISRLIIWICLSIHFQNSSNSINDIFQFVEMSSNTSRDVSSYFQWHELTVSAMCLLVQIQLNDSLICQKMPISIHHQRYDQTYVRKKLYNFRDVTNMKPMTILAYRKTIRYRSPSISKQQPIHTIPQVQFMKCLISSNPMYQYILVMISKN